MDRKETEVPNASLTKERIKIIIGIDYGTTFTGVSYVLSNKSDLNDINVVKSWPGPGRDIDGTWKTPSRIAYGQENGFQGSKWGFGVEPSMKAYSWTKLLLDKAAANSIYDDPKLSNITGKGIMELPPFRTAQGVCQDFLSQIRVFLMARLEKEFPMDFLNLTPVECWITVPAIWSDEAKNATRFAAIHAGFASRPMDSINMIPEPEAAAIASLKRDAAPDAPNPINAGNNVMIVDCGGGTVDLTTYRVTSTLPVLSFEELVVGTGGKCGATYIDRNLFDLMSQRFGRSFDILSPAKRGPGSRFMQSFETVKRDFGARKDDRLHEIGPLRLKSDNWYHYDEDEGMVKLSNDDLAKLFDPVVTQVINLVAHQVAEVNRKNLHLDRMILVGGFGDSPYLFSKLQSWCRNNGDIQLLCPEYPQAAIVRGAALRGLCGTAPSSRLCRRHYGYGVGLEFRPGIDTENDSYITSFRDGPNDDGKRRRGVEWIMKKGDEITVETTSKIPLTFEKSVAGGETSTLQLYSCSLDIAPDTSTHDRVELVGSIIINHSDFDLSTVHSVMLNGKTYWELKIQLQIQFGHKNGVLDYSTWVRGERKGTASINYNAN